MAFAAGLHRSIGLILSPLRIVFALRRLLDRLRRPDPPGDPFARVRAPKKPLRPARSASVALEEPD